MKLFDADSHMSPYQNFDGAINAQEWEKIMAGAGVSRAICWLLPQGVEDVAESNHYLYEQAKINPRMLPFGWVNVGKDGLEKSLREADTCLKEYGFAGVKINGAQNEYYIDGPEATQVALHIAACGGILAYHIGADAPDFTAAHRAASVAHKIPNTPVLMVHMGGAALEGMEDVSATVIAEAKNCSNLYLVGSAISVDKVAAAIRALGPERVLFGSDVPFYDIEGHMNAYQALTEEFGAKAMERVFWGNAADLFGLS